jgi:hypothetical protein
METLINGILKHGGHRDRLEVKVFGGAKLYEGGSDIAPSTCSGFWNIWIGKEYRQSRLISEGIMREVSIIIRDWTGANEVGRFRGAWGAVEAEKVFTALYGPYTPKSDATLF